MVPQQILQPVQSKGWLTGFGNLLSRESGKWWRTRRWWTQALIWLVILNGFVAFGLFMMPGVMEQAAAVSGEPMPTTDELYADVWMAFFGLATLALPLGVVILVQNQVLGEKQSGAAAWILSKPASRHAFLLAKLAADAAGILLIMVLLQGAVAYVQFTRVMPVNLADFILALVLVALLALFYLAFTLMMSVLASSTEWVLGASLGMLLGGSLLKDFLANVAGDLVLFTPWTLTGTINAVAMGDPVPGQLWIPVAATIVWALVCLAVAFWAFRRQEL